MRLPECVVILTGASGGIGLELAEQLCAAGARVLAVSRQMGKLAGLMNRYHDRLLWQSADLRSHEGREQVLARAREMGGVNVLINAAGVNRFALFDQIDEQALDFETEFGVIAAGLGEECVAFRGGQLTGLGEESQGRHGRRLPG